jgi:hypothetical protein
MSTYDYIAPPPPPPPNPPPPPLFQNFIIYIFGSADDRGIYFALSYPASDFAGLREKKLAYDRPSVKGT